VLVFLPGQDDIESLHSMLEDNLPILEYKGSSNVESNSEIDDTNAAQAGESSKRKEIVTVIPEQPNDKKQGDNSHSSSSSAVSNAIHKQTSTFVLYPLFAGMTPEDQMAAFNLPPRGKRKFVLATNIAETSVTISGIKYGKDNWYNVRLYPLRRVN
jgi:HrpA-like RNA helicase